MADAAAMVERCLERQQKHAPNVLEAQPRGNEDASWKVGDTYIAQSDHGIQGVNDLPPDERHPVVGGCG